MQFTLIGCLLLMLAATFITGIEYRKAFDKGRAIVFIGFLLAVVVTCIAIGLYARASQDNETWAQALIQQAIGIVVIIQASSLSKLIYNQANIIQLILTLVVLNVWADRYIRYLLISTFASFVHLVLSMLPCIFSLASKKNYCNAKTICSVLALTLNLFLSLYIAWAFARQASSSRRLRTEYPAFGIIAISNGTQAMATVIIPLPFLVKMKGEVSGESLI
jgi:hypothetical protein